MMQKTKFKQTEIGEIPEEWEVKKLNELFQIFAGGDLSKITFSKDKSKEFKYPIYSNSLKEKGLYGFSKTYQYESECITITARGDVGRAEYRNEPFNAIVRLLVLKPKNEISCCFVANFINSKLDFQIVGSAVNQLTVPMISEFFVAFPPIIEQQSIAKILSDLDSKIELNLQMNKTLEAMGQALFNHWFVNFEFPDEKGRPYKSSGGEMIDSELGEIPKGWKVTTLREYIAIERGLSYKGTGLTEEGVPMINLANMAPNHGFIPSGIKPYSGEYKERNLVNAGDIVIANTDITQKRDVLGSPAIVPDLGSNKILFTHHIYAVRNKSWIPNQFIYYLLQLKQYEERTRGFATGTTVLFLPADAILDFQFIISNKILIEKFTTLIKQIQDKLEINNFECKKLIMIRDSLLPKLMSGQIRVMQNV